MGIECYWGNHANSLKQHKYIITATYCFTRRVEEIPLQKVNDKEAISFVNKYIMARFNIPTSLVFNNSMYFSSLKLYYLSLENRIVLKHLDNYYSQGNGLEESTNKNLICILKNTLPSHERNRQNSPRNALWANDVTLKQSLGTSPYFPIYGKKVILLQNLYLSSLQLSHQSQGSAEDTLQNEIGTILKLEEERQKDKRKFVFHKTRVKIWFHNKSIGTDEFRVGDIFLKWDKAHEDKGKHTKFQALWIGHFQVR